MTTREKLFETSCWIIVILVVAIIVKLVFFTSSAAHLDQVIAASATDINKRCPVMIDSATRLDKVVFLTGNVFQFTYTLVGLVKDSIQSEDMKHFLKPILIKDITTNSAFKAQRKRKTTVSYVYHDKNGLEILRIDISAAMYTK